MSDAPHLPVVSTWSDVREGQEYETTRPLEGWRVSVALFNGMLQPFYEATEAVAVCGLDDTGDPIHTGVEVHPACLCGIYLVDTPAHLVDYWADGLGRYQARRAQLGVAWGGLIVCRIATAGNVTGHANREDMHPPDTPHCYRSNRITLKQVYVPSGNKNWLPERIQAKYPGVPVSRMRGPFHALAREITETS